MAAYYNEFDPKAAAWLRELIRCGHLPEGDVDDRSITDVDAADLRGYTQCHFFAGIGGWSLALRLAGWPEDRPVWTGSCPCPPFSAAGKGSECPSCGGKRALAHPFVTAGWICLDCGDEWRGDDRHLLPEFLRLIGQRRPAIVFGEQVASKDGRAWFSGLRAAVERVGYAAGAADLCAAGVGAPHIRQRLFFGMAHGTLVGRGEKRQDGGRVSQRDRPEGRPAGHGASRDLGRLADGGKPRLEGHRRDGDRGDEPGRVEADQAGPVAQSGGDSRVAEPDGRERYGVAEHGEHERHRKAVGRVQGDGQLARDCADGGARPADIDWRDADWLFCRDDKWRPVEPGTFPLAHGVSARVVRLRGYGNAIVPQAGQVFIESFMSAAADQWGNASTRQEVE